MKRFFKSILLTLAIYLGSIGTASAEPIYHQKVYPNGTGPFPAVILLHSSGGFKTIKYKFKRFINSGFSIYAPDFWRKHGLTNQRRMETFTEYRDPIGTELEGIFDLMNQDPKIYKNNIFAAGYSNGGFWVCFLTGNALVNAGVQIVKMSTR